MDYNLILQQLETACADFQFPAKQAAAEKVLIEFKRTPNILPVCRYVLEHTTTPLVQFHTALAIREALVRDYALLSKQDVIGVRDYLLGLCCEHENLERFVREQLLHVYAVILKRSWMDLASPEREQVFSQAENLMQTTTGHHRLVALALYNALLDEFSSSKASRIGLTLHYHQECKVTFTEEWLLRIFQSILRVMHQEIQGRQVNNALRYGTLLLEKVFSWDFTQRRRFTLSRESAVSDQEVMGETPDFPLSWRDTLLDTAVLSFFFEAYDILRHDEDTAHRARQCLVQLSGLHGAVIDGDTTALNYASVMMRGYEKLIAIQPSIPKHHDSHGPYLLGLCQMMQRLVSKVSVTLLCEIEGFYRTMSEAAKLTVQCLRDTVSETENGWNTEAFDELLNMWIRLSSSTYLPLINEEKLESGTVANYREDRIALTKFLESVCQHVIDTYLETRMEAAKYAMDDNDSDDEDSGFKDQDVFGDQLVGIARLARLVPHYSLTAIHRLLSDRMSRLAPFLESATSSEDQLTLDQFLQFLHEHTHWLLMIVGFVLADAGDGEYPTVPVAFLKLSNSQAINGPDGDQVVQLIHLVLNLTNMFALNPNSAEASHCSPLVMETLFWCLERCVKTYFFIKENDYNTLVSRNLIQAFGEREKGGQGEQVLATLIRLTHRHLILWNAEPDVLTQIIRLLNAFANSAILREQLLDIDTFTELMSLMTTQIEQLPEMFHSEIICVLSRIILFSQNATKRDYYANLLMDVINKRCMATIKRPDFIQIHQHSNITENVRSMIEMLDGFAQAMGTTNANLVYQFCSQYFQSMVELVRVYRHSPEMITDILGFFASLFENFEFDRLPNDTSAVVCQVVIELLKAYDEVNHGRKRTIAEHDESEPYQDIIKLIDMLSNLLATELSGFEDDSSKTESGNVVEVVFFGLGVLVPAIDTEMLKHPRICTRYMQFISDLVELQYDRLVTMPTAIVESILQSLKFGIDHPVHEVSQWALSSIRTLALHYAHQRQEGHEEKVMAFAASLNDFLQAILQCLVFKDMDPGLIKSASEALYPLICTQRAKFEELVQIIVNQQSNAELQQRLLSSFSILNEAVPMTMPAHLKATVVADFYQILSKFLLEACGFLRVL
ncbi:armadillo-type protein [Syncephalis plumigaleata]|nr:armadillo-type protein [Syncephalis plumigaleata]